MREIDGPEAVASYIEVPERTLSQWRYLGKGPRYARVGRHIRYRKVDVDAWLERQTIEPRPAA